MGGVIGSKVERHSHYTVCSVHSFTVDCWLSVGEEDEVSIKEAVDMIANALDFKGKIHVSFQYSPMIPKTSLSYWDVIVSVVLLLRCFCEPVIYSTYCSSTVDCSTCQHVIYFLINANYVCSWATTFREALFSQINCCVGINSNYTMRCVAY